MNFTEFKYKYPQHKEEAEERAAIMQYDGGMNKDEAEMWTVYRLRAIYRLFKEGEYENKGKH